MTGEKTVLAIDPGSSKCGLAVVRRTPEDSLELVCRKIAPAKDTVAEAMSAREKHEFNLIIVGSGTRSHELVEGLREAMPSVGILVVDEKNTTMQARERYWEFNPRRGWRRLLPATMQVPPEPVDDFVAMILAERVLRPDS